MFPKGIYIKFLIIQLCKIYITEDVMQGWMQGEGHTKTNMQAVLGVTRYLCNALRNIITFVVTK